MQSSEEGIPFAPLTTKEEGPSDSGYLTISEDGGRDCTESQVPKRKHSTSWISLKQVFFVGLVTVLVSFLMFYIIPDFASTAGVPKQPEKEDDFEPSFDIDIMRNRKNRKGKKRKKEKDRGDSKDGKDGCDLYDGQPRSLFYPNMKVMCPARENIPQSQDRSPVTSCSKTFCDDPNSYLTDANCASSIQGSSLYLVLGDLQLTDACTLNTDYEETKIRGICGSLTHDAQHAAATVRSLTFTNLEVVGQDLTLEDLKFGVISFPALVAVGEQLELQELPHLTAVHLPKLAQTGKDLQIEETELLMHIDLPMLINTGDDLSVQDNAALVSISVPHLQVVADDLQIERNDALEHVDVGCVASVGEDFKLNKNAVLTTFAADSLEAVGEDFEIEENDKLVDVSFKNLRSVIDDFSVQLNAELPSLDIPSLETVRAIQIWENNALIDVHLDSLLSAQQINVVFNFKLVSVSFDSLVMVARNRPLVSNSLAAQGREAGALNIDVDVDPAGFCQLAAGYFRGDVNLMGSPQLKDVSMPELKHIHGFFRMMDLEYLFDECPGQFDLVCSLESHYPDPVPPPDRLGKLTLPKLFYAKLGFYVGGMNTIDSIYAPNIRAFSATLKDFIFPGFDYLVIEENNFVQEIRFPQLLTVSDGQYIQGNSLQNLEQPSLIDYVELNVTEATQAMFFGVEATLLTRGTLDFCINTFVLAQQEKLPSSQAELHERIKAEMMESIQQYVKDQAAKLSEMVDLGDKEEVGNKDSSKKEKKREKYD